MDKCLYMGNLDASRDWGHEDYVEMMANVATRKAEDFVIPLDNNTKFEILLFGALKS